MEKVFFQEVLNALWRAVVAAKDFLVSKINILIGWTLIVKDYLVANAMTVIIVVTVIFSLLTIFAIVCMRTEWGNKLLIRLQKRSLNE